MAAGVGSLGGIQGAIAVFQSALSGNLREWIAADVSVQTSEPPDRAQTAVVAALERRGIERTVVVETTAQVASAAAPDPRLVLARVVDPAKYPFYGRVVLEPAAPLAADAVAVTQDLAAPGTVLEVNGKPLRVQAIIRSEPDQLTMTPTPLPRILLSYAAAEGTGLARPRTSYYQRILLRLPRGVDPAPVGDELQRAFPGRKVLDYRHPDPQAAGVLEQIGRFLRAISAIVLLVGALAVTVALWSHIEQRMDSIAIVKILGGTWRQLLAIYGLQALWLAAAGSALGVAVGVAVERAVAAVIPRLFSIALALPWNFRAPAAAALAGLAAGMLAPLPVLMRLRRIRPNRILRRAVEASRPAPRFTRRLPVALRHGVGNVLRPGNHAGPVLAAMGAAVALLFSTYLVEQSAAAEFAENFPPGSSNLFLFNVEPQQVAPLEQWLQAHGSQAVLAPFYSVRVPRVNHRSAAIAAAGLDRRWLAARMARRPNAVEILDGAWWSGAREPEVALPRMAAKALGARVGSRIEFDASGSIFTARVAAIDRIGPLDRLRCCFLFSPSAPVREGAAYHGVAEVRRGSVADMRRALYRAFPAITTVDVTESIRMLQNWLDAVLWSVRLIAMLAMASAAILLGSTVAASRMWRIREIAILKAVGARRAQLIRIYAVEFAVLGGAAGVAGVLAAAAWSRIVPTPGTTATTVAGAALIANAGGWLAAFRFLSRKPLETLRDE